jgi:hypothetical protein
MVVEKSLDRNPLGEKRDWVVNGVGEEDSTSYQSPLFQSLKQTRTSNKPGDEILNQLSSNPSDRHTKSEGRERKKTGC